MSVEQLDLLSSPEIDSNQAPRANELGEGALEDIHSTLALLDQWVELGWLRALDRALAAFMLELDAHSAPLTLMAAALTSHQLGHGHVCLDIGETLRAPDFALSLPPEGDEAALGVTLPSQVLAPVQAADWLALLAASRLVDSGAGADCGEPLVLRGARLYLRRYWRYERQVMDSLRQRLNRPVLLPEGFEQGLERLFAGSQTQPDWQKLACAVAARGAFSIITGGPGTGKTTTVVRLLALLQEPAVNAGRPLRIRLAAPTGKAAARLTESIGRQVGQLTLSPAVLEEIPTQVTTVHRLLGSRPDTRHFRHHAGNPLPLDVLVVDEASMIDLEMMANLLGALPAHARLVLLGDKDQLASVEAGAVLGDLCRDAEAGRYSLQTRQWLEQIGGQSLAPAGLEEGDAQQHPLAQQTVMLRHSHRFGAQSGIGELARAVNRSDPHAARNVLSAGYPDIRSRLLGSVEDSALSTLMLGASGDGLPGYARYLNVLSAERPAADTPAASGGWEDWARSVLAAFDAFQVLCAVRKGPWGIENLNRRIAEILQRRGLLDAGQVWYEGRPVLVTRNDYNLGLMNGDIGIAMKIKDKPLREGEPERLVLRVAFPRNDGSGGLRFILPSRLTEVETVFAMTVHKSQGSEFAHTLLILPETRSPVLTKELVYTGITRASQQFTLVETRQGIFEAAVAQPVRRISGLSMSAD
ncbi:exodeoxyribonuclease V subunit alpha [Pseudomonas sp. gcc21]|uniref:exodeoxyribonuclease V subunit alpha n=1 Tax=Pseudomonas sp. gcc21 TaxID=2726989 RepID=UPI0014516524|nr:exodeoxyribonuclease V subunit alpha [Pseudomonas sp. gcc21]QJD60206.1 exodeoxyribonuclease V subunit alpha [Pseudomonas sp. gcc21]